MKINNEKIIWVDNMKLIAMIGVITFHFWCFFYQRNMDIEDFFGNYRLLFSLPFQLGWEGNYLFFATSGIGLSLLMTKKKITWYKFFISRGITIYIPYWITIISLLIYSYIMIRIGNWDRPIAIPADIYKWIYNIFLIRVPSVIEFSSHYWYLFILVQLYILFPIMYSFSRKTGLWGIIIMVIIHILYRLFSGYIPFSGWLSFIVWFNPFYYGIYIGTRLGEDREKIEKILNKLFPVAIIVWAIGTIAGFYHTGEVIANPMASAGLIGVIYKLASLNWRLSWLNNISYEIYLIHMPFIGFYRHLFGFIDKPKFGLYIFYLVTVSIMAYVIHLISNIIKNYIYRVIKFK